MLAKPCRRLYLAANTLWYGMLIAAYLVAAAVLCDSLCRVIVALHGRLLYVVYCV